jgi:hypothetical protein
VRIARRFIGIANLGLVAAQRRTQTQAGRLYENSQQTGLVAVSRHRSRIRTSNKIAVTSQKRSSPVAEEIMQRSESLRGVIVNDKYRIAMRVGLPTPWMRPRLIRRASISRR